MDTFEKLIEILGDCRWFAPTAEIAKSMLDHGVSVQTWVPVSEPPGENGIYCVMVASSKNLKLSMRTHARYKNGRWLDLYDNWENRCWRVTHWMPLPDPPKDTPRAEVGDH